MIEKMKFLSISGPKEDIDRVINQYLCKYEIQLENALSELKTVKNLRPYIETNPYKELFQRAKLLTERFKTSEDDEALCISVEEAAKTVTSVEQTLSGFYETRKQLSEKLEQIQTSYSQIAPFCELNYDIRSILHFNHIRFRFGRIPIEYYENAEDYMDHSPDTIIYKCHVNEDFVYVVYFVPAVISKRVDAIYASLHFERIMIPDIYNGTPKEATDALKQDINELKQNLTQIDRQIQETLTQKKPELLAAYQKLKSYHTNFNVRKLAACTNHDVNTFYILCGWMTESDANAFQNELKSDEQTFCFIEDDQNHLISPPPTKLKNPRLFRPFETLIRMYGIPGYNEFDPTILFGLTYPLLFGFMFGDIGQGLLLLLGGLIFYKIKKLDLAAIISYCGFFSTIFGFLFGSIFGFENILEPLWLRPAKQMSDLPFIGKLNTVFVVAVALGMGIILFSILLSILNGIKQKDPEQTWFDTNGTAGFIFYGSILITLLLFMTGRQLPANIILVIMFAVPLLLIFFKEPLGALFKKERSDSDTSKGMFFVQGLFELFELLLSYFSNTLSFVRIGAFAVSHAAMMEVVMMLAGAEASNHPNWIVVILGNLFVCGMEGLIVGIQVLRLEYYEIFSRFYKGNGHEFKPYGKQNA